MPNMQTANCMVALGGDPGNTVPKYNITVAEMVLLRHIHGERAVFDIVPTGVVQVSDIAECQRLADVFARPEGVTNPVATVYPGARPTIHHSLEEAGFEADLFKATARVAPDGNDKTVT